MGLEISWNLTGAYGDGLEAELEHSFDWISRKATKCLQYTRGPTITFLLIVGFQFNASSHWLQSLLSDEERGLGQSPKMVHGGP